MCFNFTRYFSECVLDKYYIMLINEILTEAISLTQYESTVQDMFVKGLQKALKRLSKLQGKFPDEEQEVAQDGRSYPLRVKLIGVLSRYLATEIAKEFKNLKTVGGAQVTNVKFIKTEHGGYASGTELYISSRIIKNIANMVVDQIDDFAINASDDYPDYVNTFFTMCGIVAGNANRHSKALLNEILDKIQQGIDNIISVVTHELVHTTQHGRQFEKGRGPFEIEYRSYLDKNKGEFYKLHSKDDWYKNPRAMELYYSSPQEIPAFAHEIALYIIRAYDLPNTTTLEEIPDIRSTDIAYGMSRYPQIANFAKSEDPKARKVYQRYMKLVYAEVYNYIQRLKQKLTKEAVPAT